MALSGSIKGSFTPVGTVATITVTSDLLHYYSTVSNSKGDFLVAGLPAGTYDVKVSPALPLLPVTVKGKTVVVGATTNIGVIAL